MSLIIENDYEKKNLIHFSFAVFTLGHFDTEVD